MPATPTPRASSNGMDSGSSTRSMAMGAETVFLLPTWSLVHSRHWKMQIPYFARHFRVLTMDGLGNGLSDRCRDPERYGPAEFARDCLAVMDANGTERAVMASPLARGPVRARARSTRSGACRGSRLCGSDVPVHALAVVAPAAPASGLACFRRPLPVYRWWGHMNARSLDGGLPGVRGRGSSLAAFRSRTRRRRSRMGSDGRSTPIPQT